MTKKKKFRPQFRRGRKVNAGHPVYVYDQKNGVFHYIGLTHSKITKGLKNIPLEKNPNPNDKRQSFVRPKTEKSNAKFQTTYKDWSLTKRDKKTVKSIIDFNKKK